MMRDGKWKYIEIHLVLSSQHTRMMSNLQFQAERGSQCSHLTERDEEETLKDEDYELQGINLEDIEDLSHQWENPLVKSQDNRSETIIDTLEEIDRVHNYHSPQITLEQLAQKLKGMDKPQDSPLRYPPKNLEPSQDELKQWVHQVETLFPKGELPSMIEDLHRIIHRECSFSQYRLARNRMTILPGPKQSARQDEETKIAVSFLTHGYGLKVLREQISDPNINATKYNNTITAIMKAAFRKLEELLKFFGKTVTAISYQEEKVIRAPLINCEKWLPEDELQTFYKLIKAAYHLQKVSISPASLERLYGSITRQLQKRNLQDGREERRRNGKRTIKIQDDVKVNASNSLELIDLSGNNPPLPRYTKMHEHSRAIQKFSHPK